MEPDAASLALQTVNDQYAGWKRCKSTSTPPVFAALGTSLQHQKGFALVRPTGIAHTAL